MQDQDHQKKLRIRKRRTVTMYVAFNKIQKKGHIQSTIDITLPANTSQPFGLIKKID